VTDHTVVADRVALDVGFPAALARLRILAKGGTLPRASETAYGEGITALVELAGLGGLRAGPSRGYRAQPVVTAMLHCYQPTTTIQPSVTSWDDLMVTGNGCTARNSSSPVRWTVCS
jgi:hypothetical protein